MGASLRGFRAAPLIAFIRRYAAGDLLIAMLHSSVRPIDSGLITV